MAKKTFKNLDALNNHINEMLKNAMDKVGEEVAKELGDYVFNEWYLANGTPSDYRRTFQFLDSITFQTMIARGKVFTEVFFDDDLITPMWDEYEGWNRHMGRSGQDVHDEIVGFIEYGNNPRNSPDIAYEYEGIHMIENIREWCKKKYRELLTDAMRKQGIKLE